MLMIDGVVMKLCKCSITDDDIFNDEWNKIRTLLKFSLLIL